jgi:hypothetical protein
MSKFILTENQLKSVMETINESKNKDSFSEFAEIRLNGAEKITNNAKEKGGFSLLTYHHFKVKLPYYKRASENKLDIEETKKEFKERLSELCKLTDDVEIKQTEFQKLVGIIEVLGELIIKDNDLKK